MSAVRNARNIDPPVFDINYRFDCNPHQLDPIILTRQSDQLPASMVLSNINLVDSSPFLNSTGSSAWKDDDPMDDFDFDYETDDDIKPIENETSEENTIWLSSYLSMCKKLKRLPLTNLKKALKGKTVVVKFIKLGISDLTAVCVAIKRNYDIKELNFENNDIGPDGCELLAEVINDNDYINIVRLVTNNILVNGLKHICNAAVNAANLTVLDLSDNGITENGVEYLSKLIANSESLQELYLSKNKIMSKGTKSIANALLTPSCSLRVLDLSWNHIRLTGSEAIGMALKRNKSLEKVNLAWNGLHIEGAVSIRDALRKNDTLEELDLTCNRMSEVCIAQLVKGLSENTTLEVIRIGQNHLSSEGALKILEFIRDNKNSGLTVLDIGTQEVDENFVRLYQEIKKERDIHISHGAVHMADRKPLASHDASDEERQLLRCNPLTVLMECMRLQNYRLLDLFKQMDKDKNNFIDINELCEGMLQCGVPFKRHTMIALLKRLDKDGNEMLDYTEIVEAHGLHQRLVRQYLQDGTTFEDTEVGQVSMLLRRIMSRRLVMKVTK